MNHSNKERPRENGLYQFSLTTHVVILYGTPVTAQRERLICSVWLNRKAPALSSLSSHLACSLGMNLLGSGCPDREPSRTVAGLSWPSPSLSMFHRSQHSSPQTLWFQNLSAHLKMRIPRSFHLVGLYLIMLPIF